MKFLTAIPVYNEASTVSNIINQVKQFSQSILVVDDGSTDATQEILNSFQGVKVIRHEKNKGYGGALITAFMYAVLAGEYDALLTMDCDGQHDPSRANSLLNGLNQADIVSGSRYLECFNSDVQAPKDRFEINRTITMELNKLLNFNLTDSFCGYKAFRTSALAKLRITETGWGMPLQLWVQAAKLGFTIMEVPVPRIYLDPTRNFGTILNNPIERLHYYRQIIQNELNTEISIDFSSNS